MIIKRIPLTEILDFLGSRVLAVEGASPNEMEEVFIDNLADVERVNETTLDWINPAIVNKQEIAKGSKARVMLVDGTITPIANKVLIKVKNPKVALADVGNHFFVEPPRPGIHPTAIIDPDAKIGKDVSIGAYSVIGKASIGDYCIIDTNVHIYDCVKMGNHCVVKSGAVIGGDGFGFEKDADGNRFRFPQLGGVIIGDDVEIGANTCIDRGSLADTIIGHHTKINNLCHIAHNNVIGNNVEITGCCNISGSNTIEDDVWISPNSSVRGWIHIGKGATVGMGAVVVKNIPEGETWAGNPARKIEKK
jgi:UDP-3-O-[3-hydroxymyristoyl] glucosamine N-acyltransferase